MKKDIIYCSILVFISLIVYRVWLSFNAFVFADWVFSFNSVLKDYILPQSGGTFGFNIVLWKYPFYLMMGLLGNLGYDYNVVEKLLVFWPIIVLIPLSSFIIIKKVTASSIAAFAGSLYFTFNTYFLSINTQGHQLLPLSFGWLLLALFSYMNLLESNKRFWISLTAILLFVVGSIDLRSLYIGVIILVLFGIYYQFFIQSKWNEKLVINILKSSIVFGLIGLLNVFWVITFISVQSLTNNEILGRQLFGSEFYNIQNSLAMFYPFWSGKEPTWLLLQKIPVQFWLLPFMTFVGLIVGRKNKIIIFFGILAIIGIFLTKQEGPPFSHVYSWMFQTIPGFGAFREASKFNFILILSYSILIGKFTHFIWNKFAKHKILRNILFLNIILLPLWNTVPLLTGEINSMFVPKKVPSDFKKVNSYFYNQSDYFKILAINHNVYWAFTTTKHPVTDLIHSLNNYWRETNLFDRESKLIGAEKAISFIKSDQGKRLLSAWSFKYIVIPIEDKQTNQNIRRDTGKNKRYYVEELNKIEYLKNIDLKLDSILVYKLSTFKPLIYISSEEESLDKDVQYQNIKFSEITTTEYKIEYKNISSPIYLHLSNLYDSNWNIMFDRYSWVNVIFYKKNIHLDEANQFKNVMQTNSFIIDPKFIKENVESSLYSENSDGSINLNLTLYYKPQAYLYLGLIISVITLIICIVSLLYFLKKEFK